MPGNGSMARRRTKRRTGKKTKLPSIYNGKAMLVLLVGIMLAVALYTFDSDYYTQISSQNTSEKETTGIKYLWSNSVRCHNLMGPVGNNGALAIFMAFGLGGYLIPVLLGGNAMGRIIPGWDHLKRHFWSSLGLMLIICGTASLHTDIFDGFKPDIGRYYSAGGYVGSKVAWLFGLFGSVGGTLILGLGYAVCIYFLTDRQIFHWFENWWDHEKEAEMEAFGSAVKQKALSVLGGYKRSTNRRRKDQAFSNEMPADEADSDAFAGEAVRGRRSSRRPVAVGASANGAVSTPDDTGLDDGDNGDEADWGAFPEPTIRDMSQPEPRPVQNRDPRNPFDVPPPDSVDGRADGFGDDNDDYDIGDTGESDARPATAKEILNLSRGNEPPPVTEEDIRAAEEEAALEALDRGSDDDDDDDDDDDTAADNSAPQEPRKPLYQPRTKPAAQGPIKVASVPRIKGYKLPVISHLGIAEHNPKAVDSKDELMKNALIMQTTLSQFKIEVKLGDITKGPTITRYELHPAPGIKMEKITSLTNNLAAALQAERINILAPIPGKSSVGIEVPNRIKSMVMMRDLLESDQWVSSKARIPLALGKDVYGKPIVADLADMPHLLIAGATGSGKSVCINSVVASLLYKFRPDELRFVMIDPKVVELQQYNSLPHLVVPVVNDPKKVILALRWVINEMEKRYQIFAKVGVRNIHSFNKRKSKKAPPPNQPELPLDGENEDGFAVELDKEISVPRDEDVEIPDKLSYIVVIIDELADLMLVAPADVEMAIARITQMARAAGIHCIVATQRPSVDVITGVIKANIPCRIAFQVAAKVDSRTILDAMGADKLLGKGDMLYLPPGSAKLIRAQGALITDEEIQSIVDSINIQGKPTYEVEIQQQLSAKGGGTSSFDSGTPSGIDEDEELIEKCIDVIRSEKKASVSLMQRRLRLGYTRAARIMDELENRGIVGPSRGAEPREILVDLDGTGADGNPAG